MTDLLECFFIISPLITSVYCHHYHAFEVTDTNYILILNSKHISDYHPLYCMKPFGYNGLSSFVSLKYHVF